MRDTRGNERLLIEVKRLEAELEDQTVATRWHSTKRLELKRENARLRETMAWVRQALKGVAGAKSGSEVRDRLAVVQAALKETTL